MATGIIICGLNGAGKSTFGKALAEKLGCYFIDSEDLYFSPDIRKKGKKPIKPKTSIEVSTLFYFS